MPGFWRTIRLDRSDRSSLRAMFLLSVGLLCSCAMGRTHSVFIGATHMSYATKGTQLPVVVFEAGMGDGFRSWSPVFEQVAARAQCIAYSRPGYAGGFYQKESDGRRTADDVAVLLRKMLKETNQIPPYVLVGHSVGGAYVLRFAALYPDLVAGIVLVDARLKGFREECEVGGFSLCSPPEIVGTMLPEHVREELQGLEVTEASLPDPEELVGIPVTVIAATKPPSYAPDGLQEVWLGVQRDFANRLAEGRYVQANGAGHYVHRDDPSLVIQEITRMVAEIRKVK